jgi:hypothetical protein
MTRALLFAAMKRALAFTAMKRALDFAAMKRALAFAVAVLALAAAVPAGAAPRRVAVVVGSNQGLPGEVQLRYAESDAERIARILRELGGFAATDVVLLNGAEADEVRRSVIGINALLRAERDALLFVYFSGHGDAESLHLAGTRLDVRELRELLAGSPAGTRVLVVDSCRSGAVTRVKGGRPGPAFAIDFEAGHVEGVAILTSSAAGEDSQESDGLGASIFTHFLASALQGAADRDGDGRVTLAEAYAYAADRTLAASASTVAGPQHPTYRFELGGRDDLVLTRPGSSARTGLVSFPPGGSYLVHKGGGPEGPVVAEVSADRTARLALRPGVYHVTRRARDHLLEGQIRVAASSTTALDLGALRRVDFARVVRKGGTDRDAAVNTFVEGAVRGALLHLGIASGVIGGVRLDLPYLGLEARVGMLQSSVAPGRLTIDTREWTAGVAAFRAFDLGPVTLAGGVEASGVWLDQAFHERQTPDRRSYGLSLGPTATFETALYGPWTIRADGAFLTYLLPGAGDETRTPVGWRAGAGLGHYF